MESRLSTLRYRLAAMALAVGVAAAAGQGVAWAEVGDTDSSSSSSTAAAHSGLTAGGAAGTTDASKAKPETDTRDQDTPDTSAATAAAAEKAEKAAAAAEQAEADKAADKAEKAEAAQTEQAEKAEVAAQPVEPEVPEETPEETPAAAAPRADDTAAQNTVEDTANTPVPETPVPEAPATTEPVAAEDDSVAESGVPRSTERTVGTSLKQQSAAVATLPVVTLRAAGAEVVAPQSGTTATALVAVTAAAEAAVVDTIEPSAPKPLSPLAQLLALPGHIVNAVLQVFDFTEAVNGYHSPISWAPINDLLFAVFRGVERIFGLDRAPAVQQVVPALTYTGPTTTPTPTVAQFLNAAASEYGLGTTPGGLVPFTVNGFRMSSTNVLSGMSATAWVTPERQIIIAYQGTSGGTNLLFRPLIAITQLLADIQVIFTNTTPWAFHDALSFARQVQAQAAVQGYGTEDIFLTGHSLGGWEAEYVAQQTGWGGIGFESPGINTTVAGNGANSLFVNVETYGDAAAYMATDLPGLQPFLPAYVPGGGSKPHYGSIVMIGDPEVMTPLANAAALWGKGLLGSVVFLGDFFGNFLQYHLPGVQAYHLNVTPDPGVVTWLGTATGSVQNYGALTIPQLLWAASADRRLFQP